MIANRYYPDILHTIFQSVSPIRHIFYPLLAVLYRSLRLTYLLRTVVFAFLIQSRTPGIFRYHTIPLSVGLLPTRFRDRPALFFLILQATPFGYFVCLI